MDAASWKKVKDVLFEALQRPVHEREAFVRQRCSDDSAICAEAVTMLKDCKNETDALTTVERILRLAAEDEVDDLADLQAGTRIGPYTIIERLDRGGQGQVFLGNDQDLRRKVALKCLFSSRLDMESVRERILREARAAAAINHTNVATVHHVIEHGDRAFMVMEYVEGENLSARLRRERLRVDDVVAIGRRLTAALTAAHARSVVHRDLKPGNIRMTPDGSVKVVDFGVAKYARSQTTIISGASTRRRSAATGPAIAGGGTPPYMSPEQLRGQPVDERSDLYSLGAVLFEMATGRRLFSSSDSTELADAQARGAPRADGVDPRAAGARRCDCEMSAVRSRAPVSVCARGRNRPSGSRDLVTLQEPHVPDRRHHNIDTGVVAPRIGRHEKEPGAVCLVVQGRPFHDLAVAEGHLDLTRTRIVVERVGIHVIGIALQVLHEEHGLQPRDRNEEPLDSCALDRRTQVHVTSTGFEVARVPAE
jgi:serine/threonine protein kinase